MKHTMIAFVAVMAVSALMFATYAEAGSPIRTPRMGSALRSGRSSLPSFSGSRGRSGLPGFSSSRGRSGLPGFSSSRGRSGLPGLSRGFGSLGNRSGFGGLPGGFPGMPRFHNDHYSMSKAVRDVGIAHAVVGLVGIVANAAQAERYAAVPAGHWERRAVVVQPERYEQYQEWIPDLYDSRTGQKIGGGYYETRSRLVPQVVQYQDVYVTP